MTPMHGCGVLCFLVVGIAAAPVCGERNDDACEPKHSVSLLQQTLSVIGKKDASVKLEATEALSHEEMHVRAESQRSSRQLGMYHGKEANISDVLIGCGSVCNLSDAGTPSKFFNFVAKPFDCNGLYANTESDAPATTWPPPVVMPADLEAFYTMDGVASNDSWYLTAKYAGEVAEVPTWTTELIENTIRDARAGNLEGTYGKDNTQYVYDFLQEHAATISGKRLFIIGSERPWLEALLLATGAAHVTTIEYGKIISTDERISTMTPDEVRSEFLKSGGTSPSFDGGVTYSSVEHSGLGRYGDRLNPWGDVQAMAKAWCITKPGGTMINGVPSGPDHVHWNAHRVYGPKRYPHLMANWQQVSSAAPRLGLWYEPLWDSFSGGLQVPILYQRSESP